MPHHKKLAVGRACEHHQDQHQPVLRMAQDKAVVVAAHREQHRQREVGVTHAALLAANSLRWVNTSTGLDVGHRGALTGDDPKQHSRAHGGGHHGADK